MKKLKTLEQRVTQILTKYKKSRDNSRILIAKIWQEDSIKQRLTIHGFIFLADELIDGKLTHPDNITRIARKVKAENPKLRGTTYKQRKKDEQTGKKILKHKKVK